MIGLVYVIRMDKTEPIKGKGKNFFKNSDISTVITTTLEVLCTVYRKTVF